MKSKTIALYIIFLMLFKISFGQEDQQPISFEKKIYKAIEDTSSAYFYPKLLDKIKSEPDEITQEEMKHLYYGQIYRSGTGLAFIDHPEEGNFRKAAAQKKCEKILKLGYANLSKNPVQLTTLFPLNDCRVKYNDPDSAFLDLRIKMLLDVIFSTGDGKTKDSPIKIANIEDDYILKAILGVKGGKESIEFLDSKPMSVWTNGNVKIYFEDSWNYKYVE